MSLRKSSRSRNGSKSDVLPKPKARRKCTPAPSRVGLDLINRLMGRSDIFVSSESWPVGEQVESAVTEWESHEEDATIETRFVKTLRFYTCGRTLTLRPCLALHLQLQHLPLAHPSPAQETPSTLS